ncbi:MAG TPA: GGDEF domain-containing protein [Clostridia bacterium]|nr:GGDEF domain-containing protein [Clostridia bacterium]
MSTLPDEQALLSHREKLMEIVQNGEISSVFQPIVSLRDGSILGYEALSRGPKGTALESPAVLFAAAEANKATWELEKLCRTKALCVLKESQCNAFLFLNVAPSVIEDVNFQRGFTKEYLCEFNIDPDRVIFEITERSAVSDIAEFKQIINYYKRQHYKIAIDDAGAGYSGLNLISDLHPHFLKLDMQLIRGIDRDTVKQALVRSMQEFAKITGTFLIAEGIETLAELETLIHIGVHYGQGFYIKRPDAKMGSLNDGVADDIVEINFKKNHLYRYSLSDVYIGNLSMPTPSVNESVTVQDAYAMLQRLPDMPGFCVTNSEQVLGIVTRNDLNSAVAGVYGYSLYSKKAVSSIMDKDFLSLEYNVSVTLAGSLAMARRDDQVYDFITVTRDGKYSGIVTIKTLLNKTIEVEVSNARQLNPLTALPGNMLIEKALIDSLSDSAPHIVLYFDIDFFKAYNDAYGFENGDRVIKYLAQTIRSIVPETTFLGHVGGDDFVAIVEPEIADTVCLKTIETFGGSLRSFYNTVDLENGYIISKNRQGCVEQFPLLSISIAGITVNAEKSFDIYSLGAEASRVKKECKLMHGSAYIIL